LAAIVISFLATIYPSWQASKVNPVEALRYE
jgi:lipoprotein-releasing system permease protein